MRYLKHFESVEEDDIEYHKSIIRDLLQECIDEWSVEYDFSEDPHHDSGSGIFWRFFDPSDSWQEKNFKYDIGVVFFITNYNFSNKLEELISCLNTNPLSRINNYELKSKRGGTYIHFFIKIK